MKTNFGAQKIDSTILKTYGIVISIYFTLNKDNKTRFSKKNFL